MKQPLKGITVPMVTPLKDPDTLDREGSDRLVEHVISGGVDAIFILGTTGEGPGLSYRLRKEFIERVCRQVNGRLPVLVGITDTSFTESVSLAGVASRYGADAVVAAPPYYFKASQTELTEYFEQLADEIPLPLFLYNMPSHTQTHIGVDTVAKLADHENIVGFKDSSADLIYFQKVVERLAGKPAFTLLCGPEELLIQSLISGGHGGVNGGANMYPDLYVDLYRSWETGDLDRMAELQKRVLEISNAIYTQGDTGASYMQGLKCALSLLGICEDHLALPWKRFSGDKRERVREALDRLESVGIK